MERWQEIKACLFLLSLGLTFTRVFVSLFLNGKQTNKKQPLVLGCFPVQCGEKSQNLGFVLETSHVPPCAAMHPLPAN